MIKVKELMLTANKKSSHLNSPIFNSEFCILTKLSDEEDELTSKKKIENVYLTTDSPTTGKKIASGLFGRITYDL